MVAAMAASAMFALTVFALAMFGWAMFGLAIAARAAMRAVMTRTIGGTRFVLAVGDAELGRVFRAAGEGCRIVGAALRTIAAAVIRMAVGTLASRVFGTMPAGSALESRAATVTFATTSAARCALAARTVVVTAFRHRQSFAADIVDHDERLFHHPLDGADFAAL